MVKLIIMALVVTATSLSGGYAGMSFSEKRVFVSEKANEDTLEFTKLDAISVPIMVDGLLKGYAVARVSIGTNEQEIKRSRASVVLFATEAVFRNIYAHAGAEFVQNQLQLGDFDSKVLADANDRLGRNALKKVLIESLQFVPNDELRCREKQ